MSLNQRACLLCISAACYTACLCDSDRIVRGSVPSAAVISHPLRSFRQKCLPCHQHQTSCIQAGAGTRSPMAINSTRRPAAGTENKFPSSMAEVASPTPTTQHTSWAQSSAQDDGALNVTGHSLMIIVCPQTPSCWIKQSPSDTRCLTLPTCRKANRLLHALPGWYPMLWHVTSK